MAVVVDPVISVTEIEDQYSDASSIEVIASTTSGLALSYSVEGPATLEGTTLSLTGDVGTVTVTVSQSGNEEYNAASVSISFEVTLRDDPLSDFIEEKQLTIYPNPVNDRLSIKGLEKQEEVIILNLIGQDVMRAITNSQIDVSTLKKGIYFIKFQDESTLRFIKQ